MNHGEFLNKYEKKKVVENYNEVEKSPMVSVCVQTYQHKDFIVQCLDGILMQETTFKYEILLGEDASKDGTREICIEYANKYPDKIRLFLHHRDNNIEIGGNPSGRFNFLYNLGFSKGKYIALCEGDDYWTDPFKLQKQVDFLEKNDDFSISFHNVEVVYDSKSILNHLFHKNKLEETTDLSDIVKGNYISTCSILYRKSSTPYPEYIYTCPVADWVLNVHFAQFGKIHYVDEAMSAYRIHDGGIYQHHHNWSADRLIENRLRFIALRIIMLKQFEELPEIVRIIKNKINFTYYEIILLEIKKKNKNSKDIIHAFKLFFASGIVLSNMARLIYKLPFILIRMKSKSV